MRILQVLEAAGAGAFGVVSSLVDRLDRAGHDVTLAVGRRPETPDHLEQLIPAGVSVVHLPWQRRTLRAQPPAARARCGPSSPTCAPTWSTSTRRSPARSA